MAEGKVTSIVLFDLSVVHDRPTGDHPLPLHRLRHWFEVSGPAMNWFATYSSEVLCHLGLHLKLFQITYHHRQSVCLS